MGAYLESNFRYQGSGGAAVARIRILTSRMKSMKEKELAHSLNEIEGIT